MKTFLQMPEECHNSEQRYELVVRSVLNNDTLSSLPVLADQITMLQIGNLLESNLYVFTITSLNLIGEGRSEEISFCKFKLQCKLVYIYIGMKCNCFSNFLLASHNNLKPISY